MRVQIISWILLALLVPNLCLALCSNDGATIVYVNGVMTSYADAQNDLLRLEQIFDQKENTKDIRFENGYNPIHLDGFGDEIESISQAFGTPISDYDLDTILSQIAPEVTTRKLLLVGHSQGSFYTNEMYDYLIAHGVPRSSIAVYNVATPADRVAGGGAYLTSGNDKLINQVRIWDAEAGLPQPLPANILIPFQSGDDTDPYGGHYFETDYLVGAGTRIVHDVEAALAGLSANGTSENDSCFDPPPQGLSYQVQKAAFALTDPATASVDAAAKKAASAIATAYASANNAVDTALADAIFTVIPRPTVENAGSAFAVEKALYGSSLSEADYEALLDGDDVPEVQVSQSAPTQSSAPIKSETPAQPAQGEPEVLPTSSRVQPVPPKAMPTASAPVAISISPGFGGGSAPIASSESVSPPPSDPTPSASSSSQTEPSAETSSTTESSQDLNQPVATSTDTTTIDIVPSASSTAATSTPQISPEQNEATSTLQTIPQVSCDQDPFAANGYFFDSSYQQVEYVGGLLRVHLKLLTPFNDGRPFRAKVYEIGSDCSVPGFDGFSPQDHPSTVITQGVQNYSFRMTSATHWVLWDDESDLQLHCTICEGDISTTTLFVSFYGIVDDFTANPSRVRTTPYRPSE